MRNIYKAKTVFYKYKLGFGVFFVSIFAFFAFATNAYAKIEITVDRTYSVNQDLEMEVKEVHTVFNNSSNLYIPGYETIDFVILGFRVNDPEIDGILQEALDSVRVTESFRPLPFETSFEDEQVSISVSYGEGLFPNNKRVFTFEYKHPALVYENGSITDAYIHAFAEDFEFSTADVDYQYNTKLEIDKAVVGERDIHFVNPTPTQEQEMNGKLIYEFSQESLVDQYVWLQVGKEQVFDFRIDHKVVPTDDKNTGLKNSYDIVIPRDFVGEHVSQTVYFKQFDPRPTEIWEDDEGNLVAKFRIPAHEAKTISISGYAHIQKYSEADLGALSQDRNAIAPELLSKYTAEAEFWEVSAPEIQAKANEVRADQENVYNIAAETYKYVVNTIDYSEVKRFGLNRRQGALKTLQGGAAVCMEYSDLFLTLMRANNVPARAAFGYGYDPRVDSTEQEAHQWVQVYVPGLENNWVDVDVTWGESGDLLIGGDLNHFYTHVAYKDPNTPAVVSRLSYGASPPLDAPQFNIITVSAQDLNLDTFDTTEELLQKYPVEERGEYYIYTDFFTSRYVGGYESLLNDGIDIENFSQIFFLAITGIGGLTAFFVLTKLVGLFLPKNDSSKKMSKNKTNAPPPNKEEYFYDQVEYTDPINTKKGVIKIIDQDKETGRPTKWTRQIETEMFVPMPNDSEEAKAALEEFNSKIPTRDKFTVEKKLYEVTTKDIEESIK